MKTAVIHQFGGPEVLSYEDTETPEPRPGNLLIKVLAAGVNRFDHYIREGSVTQQLSFPHVLGSDASGEVAALGNGVDGFSIGDRVVPLSGFPAVDEDAEVYPLSAAASFGVTGLSRPGSYAQYLEVPARWVLADDTGLAPELVATLPVVATTGVRAVKVVGEVKAGERVLITAGASGMGTFMIQAAKALGAQVAATVRNDDKAETVTSLGADLTINTRTSDLVAVIRDWTGGKGVDVAIDSVGGDLLPRVIDATKPQGVIVAVGFVAGTMVTFDIREFFFGQKQLRGSMSGDIEDLRLGLELVRSGKIRPIVDRTLPLSEAADAHRLIASNRTTGKLVLLPWGA